MRKSLICGVMGHVDHGKTAFVKALTGIDTDRLAEEKRRGLSITLGFAPLRLASGDVDIVDMPGHERFVRTMVSGATGVQTAILIVDADEGPREQTKEHLAIAEILNIDLGLVVMSRCDRVDASRLSTVEHEIRDLLQGTSWPNVPIEQTSAVTGRGIDRTKERLNDLLLRVPRPLDRGAPVLPIDRCFSLSGIGTVVTGTLRWGHLSVGQPVVIAGSDRDAVVRELQTHGHTYEVAPSGRRVAANLRGVSPDEIQRGSVIAPDDLLTPSVLLDAEVRLCGTAPAPLKHNQSVQLLIGTFQVIARVSFLEQDAMAPGQTGLVQFRSKSTIMTTAKERFVVRIRSPSVTIGGGVVLDPAPQRHRRNDAEVIQLLKRCAESGQHAIVPHLIESLGPDGIATTLLARLGGVPTSVLKQQIGQLNALILADGYAISEDRVILASEALLAALANFHKRNPTKTGMPLDGAAETVRQWMSADRANGLIATLRDRKQVVCETDVVRLKRFDPGTEILRVMGDTTDSIEALFKQAGLSPVDLNRVIGNEALRSDIIKQLIKSGKLVRVPGKSRKSAYVFHKDAVDRGRREIEMHLSVKEGFTASQARKLLKMNRKLAIPLLEYYDTIGFTIRDGDRRTLKKTSA